MSLSFTDIGRKKEMQIFDSCFISLDNTTLSGTNTIIRERPHATLWPHLEDIISGNCDYKNIIMFTDAFQFLLMLSNIILGAYFLIFGYRNLKQTLFSVSLTLVYSYIYTLLSTLEYVSISLKTILSISPAILCGKISMQMPSLGMSLTGFVFGVMFGIVPLLIYGHLAAQADLSQVWSTISCLLSGIIFSFLNRKWRKGPSIVATSAYGSTLISIVIDYINNNWTGFMWVLARLQLAPAIAQPCRLTWVTLAAWLVFTMLGIIIQYTLTGTAGVNQEQNVEAVQNPRPACRCNWSFSDCFLSYCSETSRESGGPSPPYTPAKSAEEAEENIPLQTLSGRISEWRSRLPGIAEEIERYCEQCHCCELHPTKRINMLLCDNCRYIFHLRTMRGYESQHDGSKRASST